MQQRITTLMAFVRRLNENFWVKMQCALCGLKYHYFALKNVKRYLYVYNIILSHTRRKSVHVHISISTNYKEKTRYSQQLTVSVGRLSYDVIRNSCVYSI